MFWPKVKLNGAPVNVLNGIVHCVLATIVGTDPSQ